MGKSKGPTPVDKQIEDWLGEKVAEMEAGYYTEEEQRRFNYDAIGDIVGPHRYGIPFLLKRKHIQVMFDLSKRSAQRFIKRYLIPMGAVIQVGSQYLIQPWGVYRLLNPNGLPPRACEQIRPHLTITTHDGPILHHPTRPRSRWRTTRWINGSGGLRRRSTS